MRGDLICIRFTDEQREGLWQEFTDKEVSCGWCYREVSTGAKVRQSWEVLMYFEV